MGIATMVMAKGQLAKDPSNEDSVATRVLKRKGQTNAHSENGKANHSLWELIECPPASKKSPRMTVVVVEIVAPCKRGNSLHHNEAMTSKLLPSFFAHLIHTKRKRPPMCTCKKMPPR